MHSCICNKVSSFNVIKASTTNAKPNNNGHGSH